MKPEARYEGDEDPCFVELTGEEIILLPDDCKQVTAMCEKVKRIHFPYMKDGEVKLVFSFRVLEPEEYAGIPLSMYCRVAAKWGGRFPPSSNIWKALYVALGRTPKGRLSMTTVFKGRQFICKVGKTKPPASYSVIREIVK